MKIRNKLFSGALLIALGVSGHAASLTYNVSSNLGWFAPDAWNGPATWSANDSATFTNVSALTVQFDGSTTISQLTHTAGSQQVTLTSSTARTLTFNGGTMNLSGSLPFTTGNGVTVQGDYTINGNAGALFRVDGGSNVSAYSGTVTINNAGFAWSQAANVGSNSNFVVNGGILQNRFNSSSTLGSVTLNGGDFQLGRNNSDGSNSTTTVSLLAGTGGTITGPSRTGNPSLTLVRTLNVNQTANSTYAGSIEGVNGGARIVLNKQNTGTLILTGNVVLQRQTTVSGGSLLINGAVNSFSNESGSTAIFVDGGRLGGTGTINISGGDQIVLSATGGLVAGGSGSAGRTTYAFSSGGSLDLSAATAGSSSGWLNFELGSDASAGTTYDQVRLTGAGSTLNIGSGLSFSDFNFTALAGFAPGNYVLFETLGIVGTLDEAIGNIGGYDVMLAIQGNNLVLDVIPEPATGILGVFALASLALLRRRKE